jgi:hypothetical protein
VLITLFGIVKSFSYLSLDAFSQACGKIKRAPHLAPKRVLVYRGVGDRLVPEGIRAIQRKIDSGPYTHTSLQ